MLFFCLTGTSFEGCGEGVELIIGGSEVEDIGGGGGGGPDEGEGGLKQTL